MTLPVSPLPTGPDYAAALLKLRKWRTLLGLIVILVLLTQITLFFLYKFDVLGLSDAGAAAAAGLDPEAAAVVATDLPARSPVAFQSADLNATGRLLKFLMSLGVFLATICAFMLAVVGVVQALLLVADRRLGIAHSLSGFGWALLAAFVVLPWQIFFHDAVYQVGEFAVPGALWLTSELWAYGRFGDDWGQLDTYLRYGRFVAWPLFAIVLTALAMAKIGRPTKTARAERDAEGSIDEDDRYDADRPATTGHYAAAGERRTAGDRDTTVFGGHGRDTVVTDA